VLVENAVCELRLCRVYKRQRFGGLMSCIGYLGGKQDDAGGRTNANRPCWKRNATLKGIVSGPRDVLDTMLESFDEKNSHPVIDVAFTLEEADQQWVFWKHRRGRQSIGLVG